MDTDPYFSPDWNPLVLEALYFPVVLLTGLL